MRWRGADRLGVAVSSRNGEGAKGPAISWLRTGVNPQWEEPMSSVKPYSIPKHLVVEAYRRVRTNQGAAGVDGKSIAAFEKDLKNQLYKIWNRMSSGSYFPPPVRLVEIEKKGGGIRPLGIPTVADRVAQTVVKLVLEPMVEPVFHPDSYGYRPGRSAHDAVAKARQRCLSTVHSPAARRWATIATRVYQSDSSSKRPDPSVLLASWVRIPVMVNACSGGS